MNELVVVQDLWTHFWDMHSGGRTKEEPFNHIFIQAPEVQAIRIFYERFGHNPHRVTCTCCGEDYSVNEGTIQSLSAYHRNATYEGEDKRECSMDEYVLKYLRQNPNRYGKRIGDLYRMSQDKSSPEEAAVAYEMLMNTRVEGIWRPQPFISLEKFLETNMLAEGLALVIPDREITAEEWALTQDPPEEGYVWR